LATHISQVTAPPQHDAHAPDDLVELGRVSGAWGVRGGLKIHPHAADPAALLKARRWWLRLPAARDTGWWRAEVISAKMHGSEVTASWSGVSDRDAAEAWKGASVWVPRSAFPALPADEFYWVDLIGCRVSGYERQPDTPDQTPNWVGVVEDVSDNGAHAILAIDLGTEDAPVLDARGRRKSVLVPFVPAHVPTADMTARHLVAVWPLD
jgi:16S rRNA processing protein RimM